MTPRTRAGKFDSEFTRMLRERSLEAIIITACAICGVSVRMSAKKGHEWFKDHVKTKGHKKKAKAMRNGR